MVSPISNIRIHEFFQWIFNMISVLTGKLRTEKKICFGPDFLFNSSNWEKIVEKIRERSDEFVICSIQNCRILGLSWRTLSDKLQLNLYETDLLFWYLSHHLKWHCSSISEDLHGFARNLQHFSAKKFDEQF